MTKMMHVMLRLEQMRRVKIGRTQVQIQVIKKMENITMKNFNGIVLIVVFTAVIGSVACLAEPNSMQSVDKLKDALVNDQNENTRIKAASLLGEAGDASVSNVLVQSILTDSSCNVRLESLKSQKQIFSLTTTELYKKQDGQVRSDVETEKQVLELIRKNSTPLKKLFNPSYKYNCNYQNEVKAEAAYFFTRLDEPEILTLLLDELRRTCAVSFEKRKEKEKMSPCQGDILLGSLVTTISASRGRLVKTDLQLVYTTKVEDKFVPILENELKDAKDDYKLSLLVILGQISMREKYDPEHKNFVKLYILKQSSFSDIEAELVRTQSYYLKREALRILKYYNYQLTSESAKEIAEEFARRSHDNIKF